MKYPGAKTVLIPDIMQIFLGSRKRSFVDVFGGSGIVSLNTTIKDVVYNEKDPELSNLFRHLKEHPERIIKILRETVNSGSLPDNNQIRNLCSKPGTIDAAFGTLMRFTVSFGGMGDTYNTREKSTLGYARKTLGQMESITSKVKSWKIENMDFRELFKKYDSPYTFFYMDPPYSDRRWYNYNFTGQDYEDLRVIMTQIEGKYLMTVDRDDDYVYEIFGKPQLTMEYENKNQDTSVGFLPPRVKSFYTNIKVGTQS